MSLAAVIGVQDVDVAAVTVVEDAVVAAKAFHDYEGRDIACELDSEKAQ
jgi:hypothetical protein